MAPIFPEYFLIDFRPQEDLMFWDQIIRSLARAKRDGRWICLVVGAAEQAERILIQGGFDVTRTNEDELSFPESLSDELERLFVEEKRKLTTRLTDEGISAVGMMAFDRGLVRIETGQIKVKKGVEERLWQAPAVMPVLMSVCKTGKNVLKDVHPIKLSISLSRYPGFHGSITILTSAPEFQKNTLLSNVNETQKESLIYANYLSAWVRQLPEGRIWHLSGPNF